MEHAKAKEIAVTICWKLKPFCDKLNIAGSIRRLKPEVKDIEVVCTPIIIEQEQSDLFGSLTVTRVIHPGFARVAQEVGEVVKGKPTGRYMKIALPEGIMLDLFIPQAEDYYRQFAVRTGSADYSRFIIANGWVNIGWVGTEDGLRRERQCTEKKLPDGKRKWICEHPNPDLPPVWESEAAFFDWLNVPYKQPKDRNF